MEPRERFGANLKAVRAASGLSQKQLSDLCSMYRTEVSLLERGERAPRLATLVKLAAALGVSVDALCSGMSWDEDEQCFVVRPRPTLPPRRY